MALFKRFVSIAVHIALIFLAYATGKSKRRIAFLGCLSKPCLLAGLIIGMLGGFDTAAAAAAKDLLQITPKNSVVTRLYTAILDRDIKKRLDPNNLSLQNKLVSMAELAGALSFAYRLPESQYQQDSLALEAVRRLGKAFTERQLASGHFSRGIADKTTTAAETAAILECFVYILHNLGEELGSETRSAFRTLLQTGMGGLMKHKPASNHQDALIAGVLALGGYYFDHEAYHQSAQRYLNQVLPRFQKSGEVRVGPGPDIRQSLQAIRGMFLYRRFSQEPSLDPVLRRSLQWVSKLFTSAGVPLEGMSTQTWTQDCGPLVPLMGALTFYAEQQPEWQQLATHYMNAFINLQKPHSLQHGAFTFLLGANYYTVPKEVKTVPYTPYIQLHENEHSTYCLVGKNYQTAVTLRSRLPLKGLQTWSYKGQPPLVFPIPNHVSKISGKAYASHQVDVNWLPDPPYYQLERPAPGLHTLIMRQDDLITAYLFSQDATTVIYRQPSSDEAAVSWNIALPVGAKPERITKTQITFKDSEARILSPFNIPDVENFDTHKVLHYIIEAEFIWFTFAGPQALTIVRPVTRGLVLVQLQEGGDKQNVLLNLSSRAFSEAHAFPGTTIAIPQLEAYSSTLISGQNSKSR